mmetsp:Transcript_108485/g.188346  ORF Transcript_108485/g.188346 Transcript_108485/m.188346 type:complete len:210 (-) Transcript_108485:23-652(-)
MSPFLSLSRSAIMLCISSGFNFMPTPSKSCSNSSTDMVPELSIGTSSSRPLSSLTSLRQSCLKRQKICRNSSRSSAVMPCFFLGAAASSFFFGGNFSAALMALSNSLRLTSPPPSLSTRAMITANSLSEQLKPISARPFLSSSASRLPSPLASIFRKRSVARIFFAASFSTKLRMTSSGSDMVPLSQESPKLQQTRVNDRPVQRASARH